MNNRVLYVVLGIATTLALCLIVIGAVLIVASNNSVSVANTGNSQFELSTPWTPSAIEYLNLTYGTFAVPGTGYIDGRTEDRSATIMNISIWDDVTPPRKFECFIPHGTRVQIYDAAWNNESDMYALEVEGAGCRGWVNEWFVNTQYEAAVGDKLP